MTAIYDRLLFKTQLEAQWAAFFDLAGWDWKINPAPVGNWAPDFRVRFDCGHSECLGAHSLLVSVLPVPDVSGFSSHPCLSHAYGVTEGEGETESWLADGGAAFGLGPKVTHWEISHGAGGGVENLYFRVPNADELWEEAAKLVTSPA